MSKLSKEPDRLCFEGADDSINYANQIINRVNCIDALKSFGLFKYEAVDQVHLHLKVGAGSNAVEFELIIPMPAAANLSYSNSSSHASSKIDANTERELMLIGVSYDRQRPEQGVAVRVLCVRPVGLEGFKCLVKLNGDIFVTPFGGGKSRSEVADVLPKREIYVLRLGRRAQSAASSPNRLVENITQVIDDSVSTFLETIRRPLGYFDAIDPKTAHRVKFVKFDGLVFSEVIDCCDLKLVNFFASPSEHILRPFEEV